MMNTRSDKQKSTKVEGRKEEHSKATCKKTEIGGSDEIEPSLLNETEP